MTKHCCSFYNKYLFPCFLNWPKIVRCSSRKVINNGNWTKWSAIWSEIIRVISNIEHARSASSIWNLKYDFRPKLHDTKFNYHFIKSSFEISQFNSPNTVFLLVNCQYFIDLVASFFRKKKQNPKCFYISKLKLPVKNSVERNQGKNIFHSIWLVVLFLFILIGWKKKMRFRA